MLIGVFKSNQRMVNVLTVLLVLIFWAPAFFVESNIEDTFSGYKKIDILIAILLVGFQAVYLNRIINNHKLVDNNSHLTSLLFVIINSYCIQVLELNQLIIANTFIIIAFQQFLKLYGEKKSYEIMFNASFLIAIASILYTPYVVFMLLIWAVVIYLRTPLWRDFIISIIGFSIPYVYFVVYHIMVDDTEVFVWYNKVTLIYKDCNHTLLNNFFFIVLVGIMMFALLSLYSILSRSIVKVRRMMVVVIFMLLTGLSTIMLNSMDYMATFILLSVPLAIIIANFFQNMHKKWLAELVFLCLMIGVVLNYFS
jgi:hypothetical protein